MASAPNPGKNILDSLYRDADSVADRLRKLHCQIIDMLRLAPNDVNLWGKNAK